MKKMFFVIIILVLCICTTGCGMDDAAEAANNAKEAVVNTANNAKEGASWWTRHTDHQSWTNASGTKIEIKERRKEGDFQITVTYGEKDLNSDEGRGWNYSGDGTATMFVEELTDELIDELRKQ